jgi:RNA polymerase sigma-54 factor
MGIELRQQLKLSQQLVMTPQLQMAIRLLQLSRLELVDAIQQELELNPALDEVQEEVYPEDPQESSETQAGDKTLEISIEEKIPEDIDWGAYMDHYNSPAKASFESEDRETPQYETFVAKKESLVDHLLWQLMMTTPTPHEERIGSLIIGNLNPDGYLDADIDEMAKANGGSPKSFRRILNLIQTFDPIGVAARDLKECLLIQARYFGCDSEIVTEIIENHLTHLENRNYRAIAKAMRIEMDAVTAAVNIIKGLEPRPGSQFTDEPDQFINPDIFLYKLEDDFVITLNDDGMPRLRINAFYQNAVNSGKAITGSARDYLQEKIRSASWLIKSIQQRQKTIYRVMESILNFQRDFFDKGVAYLKPMILKDVAQDIGMHESTISRVTTNKYVYTPRGIFELKYFFNSSINQIEGEALASASVQDKIRQIIESEDPQKPYSDQKISQMLNESNIDIARRTVAKYREMLRILPSNKRKQP